LHRSTGCRERALWHVTDLLLAGRYNEEQIWVFGEVIDRLANEIEVAARARLAKRLARSSNAPFGLVMVLASHDSIEVAGPILQHSPRLDTRALVASAKTKGQPHLLAISKRRSIPAEVTDELVKRGDRQVVRSVASNSGAHFSEFGFLQLIRRSETDAILAEQLCLREEIPRHLFQQLIAKASDEVKRRLEQERPDLADLIHRSVSDLTASLQAKFGPASKGYFAAKKVVEAQARNGSLNEPCILEYARSHKIEEATVGLSLMCSLPAHVIERALFDCDGEATLLLAKALGFSWETAMALLFLGAKDHRISANNLDRKREEFARLDRETCQSVLQLFRARRHATESIPSCSV
jgi:uncharacterized protein (DUF2336 family)